LLLEHTFHIAKVFTKKKGIFNTVCTGRKFSPQALEKWKSVGKKLGCGWGE